jgi:hypothetical protein
MHDNQTVPDDPSFALQNTLKFEKFSFKLARRGINAARIADIINLRPHLPTAVSSSRARAGPHGRLHDHHDDLSFVRRPLQVFIPCSCCGLLAPSSPCTIPVCRCELSSASPPYIGAPRNSGSVKGQKQPERGWGQQGCAANNTDSRRS